MPVALKTVCQYIAEVRKKDSFYLTFNTAFNDICVFKKIDEYDIDDFYNEKYTDYEKRDEFIDFMNSNFPDVKLIEVYDLSDMLVYPYLGTLLVDADLDSEVFKVVCERFEKPNGDPIDNRLIIWELTYEKAKKFAKMREKMFEGEF